MWRFREILPLRTGERPVTLDEGDTPLIPLERLGESLDLRLLVKDEGRNPTGSFKDRGLAAAVTRAALDGAESFVIPSAGNAGAALAAYAARAGLPARIYLPRDTPAGVETRCRAFGAEIVAVDGLITDCGRLAAEHAARTGAFDLSTLREPYRIEGKKTMALEILEALGWKPPDAVVYPTGGGTGLIGTWKALRELEALGLVLEPRTRLYSVQAAGCAPIVRAWKAGETTAEEWSGARTEAWGLRVPRARGDFLILRALRETGGGAVAVEDGAMTEGARALLEVESLNACIEGGAVLAAARALREQEVLRAGETVVLFNTGNLGTY
jgi:threonine synthase